MILLENNEQDITYLVCLKLLSSWTQLN